MLLWPCVVLIIGIGTARAFQMRKHERRTAVLSYDEAKAFEPRYAIGCISYAAVVGIWAFITIYGSDDAVAHMIVVALTIGYTAGGAARNYGRPWLPQLHILFACAPLALALALHGGVYYIGLAILLGLFFIALKGINLSLHQIFVKAMTSSFREAALAGQFDTALNNMPHGLCMFRADGRLAVMNHRFSEMMGLPDDFVERGVFASDIVDACVLAGAITRRQRQGHPRRDRGFAGARRHHHRSRHVPRPLAVVEVPADGRRRRRRAGGGHHRAPRGRSQDQPSGAL